MHKNPLWLAFLIIIFAITVFYTSIASYRYYLYSRLNKEATPESIVWKVEEISSDKFIAEATYRFLADGKLFSGKTLFDQEPYLNRWAAERTIDEKKRQHWIVWYEAFQPSHSSLQKKFPFKEWISAVLLWLLFIYFLWLGFYVARFKT